MPNDLQNFNLWLPTLALFLAAAAALWVDHRTFLAQLTPPGFDQPLRRALALTILVFLFAVGIFGPLLSLGNVPEVHVEDLTFISIFFMQGMLILSLILWYFLGYGFLPEVKAGLIRTQIQRELGLGSADLKTEVGVGLASGIIAWGLVLSAAMVLAVSLYALGAGNWLEQESPTAIVWLAALPMGYRLLISLSAGVVEEIFFRGFLQKRIGLVASTVFFVAGHAGYGQPFMLFGITLLSLFYGLLARWRGSVWAAIVAHFLFDAVQLLVFIPFALRLQETGMNENFVASIWI
jgi:membrane protease YdiL (CAAX protease family)